MCGFEFHSISFHRHFIVMLKSFALYCEYSLLFVRFFPQEIFIRSEKCWNIFRSILLFYIPMFITESSNFSFILTSSQRALNRVYFRFEKHFRRRIFFSFSFVIPYEIYYSWICVKKRALVDGTHSTHSKSD